MSSGKKGWESLEAVSSTTVGQAAEQSSKYGSRLHVGAVKLRLRGSKRHYAPGRYWRTAKFL